ncbi:hypothetical protein [Methylobacterium oryzihabitans]|nr:hypothetical protein [Methylobacterium oryzihabitans]
MTLAEWHAAVEGFAEAHAPAQPEASEDEFLRVLSEEIAAGRA